MARFIFQNEIDKLGLSSEFIIDAKAVSREEIGNDMYPPAAACLKKHNIPFTKTASRQITLSDYEYYDLLIIMDKSNEYYLKRIVGNDNKNKIKTLLSYANIERDISDPWYTSDFEECYNDICIGIKGLLKTII